MPNHSKKIELALVAYLTAKNFPPTLLTVPASETETAVKRIFPGESDAEKTGPCILCIMDDMQEETPEQSGNRYSQCRVELRTPISVPRSDEDPQPLEAHVATAELLETYLMTDDLAAQLTAAIGNFTVMGILNRQPIQEQGEDFWMNGFIFRMYSCPRSFT